MKFRLFLLCALVVPIAGAQATPAKSRRRMIHHTVVDYLRLLPAQPIDFDVPGRRNEMLGKKWRHAVDSKRDYLKIIGNKVIGDDVRPSLQCKVFRFAGRDVLAVSTYNRGEFGFDLWSYEGARWRMVTSALAPPIDGDDLNYVLPRVGTTIRVFLSDGTLLTKLQWRKGRFVAEDVL